MKKYGIYFMIVMDRLYTTILIYPETRYYVISASLLLCDWFKNFTAVLFWQTVPLCKSNMYRL